METQTTEAVLRKSELTAQGRLDYRQLQVKRPDLLPCVIEETKEELHMTWDITGCRPMTELRQEKKKTVLLVLLGAAALAETARTFRFALTPDNIYYDRFANVKVQRRDIYPRGEDGEDGWFLPAYKALAGYALQNRFRYEDYSGGGEDLYGKNKILRPLMGMQTVEEVKDYLDGRYRALEEEERSRQKTVSKSWYRMQRIYTGVSLLLLLALGGYTVYAQGMEAPRRQAMLEASNAYTDNDYMQVIETLRDIKTEEIEEVQQYMLAVSYVKSENLTLEQKENILSTIALRGDAKTIRYWIALGRMEIAEAQNIALQKSDDELLLYAYLKEKSILETDQNIPGEEKAARLESLQKNIDALAQQYRQEE